MHVASYVPSLVPYGLHDRNNCKVDYSMAWLDISERKIQQDLIANLNIMQ